MPSIKFYTDEHVGKAIINGLRLRGINVISGKEADLLSAADEDHLEFALKEGRVIFTQDDDFLKLHAKGFEHAGIVYAPQGTSIGKIVRGLELIYRVLSPEDMYGHVEFL